MLSRHATIRQAQSVKHLSRLRPAQRMLGNKRTPCALPAWKRRRQKHCRLGNSLPPICNCDGKSGEQTSQLKPSVELHFQWASVHPDVACSALQWACYLILNLWERPGADGLRMSANTTEWPKPTACFLPTVGNLPTWQVHTRWVPYHADPTSCSYALYRSTFDSESESALTIEKMEKIWR